jgi:hypothetical protein
MSSRTQHDRDDQNRQRDPWQIQRFRIFDLVDTLVHGEDTADAEQDDRHHEGIEVALPAESERVLRGRRALGPLPADQQEHLIAGIGERVHRFGQHRGRTGDQVRGELRHRDAEIGQQRGDDRPGAARRTHAAPSRAVGVAA